MTQQAPTPPAKKGIPVLGWLGIGCGTIVIIGVVVVSLLVGWCKRKVGDLSEFQRNPEKAAAEMMVRLSPELTLVSQDEAKGEMTIRTKDGSVMTMSYKDVGEGKFRFKDAKGNLTEIGGGDLSKLPPWVPAAADLKQVSTSRNQQEGQVSGMYCGQSAETLDALDGFFKTQAAATGMNETNRSSLSNNGTETRILAYEGGGHTLNIILSSKGGGETGVQVTYEDAR